MEKVKISAVSYLNTKPFVYGIENNEVKNSITLELDMPSLCAQKLLENKVDIGLVPVAIIPHLKEAHIITDNCIGAVGAVSSVVLYSDVPLSEIKTIQLDYQSRTSVNLTRVLAANYWKISPQWEQAKPGYENGVEQGHAAVIIGDRTFGIRDRFRYAWDLSEEWMNFTGLPFVFACWVANKELPKEFIGQLNQALKWGVDRRLEVADQLRDKYPNIDVRDYLGEKIRYDLDEPKRKGLARFLGYLAAL